MQIFGITIFEFLFDKHLAETLVIGSGFIALIARVWSWGRTAYRRRKLPIGLQEKLKEARDHYIRPDFLTSNPGYSPRMRDVTGKRSKLIPEIEQTYKPGSKIKRIIVLAGSGMGKTSLMFNLYDRYLRKFFRSRNVALIELGQKGAIEKIVGVEDAENTILFLDALDENSEAVSNYKQTIEKVNLITRPFFRVILTCRAEFFSDAADVPALLGFIGGVAPAGELGVASCKTVYLAPLSRMQVSTFLVSKFLFSADGSFKKYQRAKSLADMVPNVVIRPMLLTYIDVLLDAGQDFSASYQLYEAMIKGWLQRRKSVELDPNYTDALNFVRLLAVNLVTNYKVREGYHVERDEALEFAHKHNIGLEEWQITGRSILSVDAQGRYKFAHLSFLEVLVARAVFEHTDISEWQLTDQAAEFVGEMVIKEGLTPKADLSKLNLVGVSFKGADLPGATLKEIKLRDVDLSDANLKGADLTYADLEFLDLRKGYFDEADFSVASLRGTNVSDTSITGAKLDDCDFTGANIQRAEWTDISARRVNFFGADISGSVFTGCDFREANFSLVRIAKKSDGEIVKPIFEDCQFDKSRLPVNWKDFLAENTACDVVIDKEPCEYYELP